MADKDVDLRDHMIEEYFHSGFNYKEIVVGHRSVIREDIGTENVRIAAIQRYLRNEGGDSWSMKKSFLYGRSVANQKKSNCSSFCCNSFFY